MKGKERSRRFGANREALVLLCLAFLTFYWAADALYDTFLHATAPSFHYHNFLGHLLVFSLQLVLIGFVWQLVSRRRGLEARLQDALRQATEERNRADAIVAALGDGISIQDRDYRVIYQNEAHRRLAGGEFIGKYCYKAYDRREDPCPGCPVALTFADGGIHRHEKQIDTDGGLRVVEVVTSPLHDANGNLVAAIEVVRDVTARKQADAEIRKLNDDLQGRAAELSAANEELESFSYSLSHDLRAPLSRIYTAAQLLQEDATRSADEQHVFLVRTICQASEKMEELIEAILTLAQVGRKELLRQPVDLSELATEMTAQLRLLQPEREVEFVIAPGLVVDGDPRLLRAALQNLLENAWKYTQKAPRARIELGVRVQDGRRCYFVRDNGVGFAMEQAADLFRPFERLHHTADFPGTGIGLATVQRVILRHGGQVWAEAEVGQGATFYFTIP